ncbi:28381_t:CDS:1, partial [Racocetra persica]
CTPRSTSSVVPPDLKLWPETSALGRIDWSFLQNHRLVAQDPSAFTNR